MWLQEVAYLWNLKKAEIIKTELNGGCQGLRNGEIGERMFKGTTCN